MRSLGRVLLVLFLGSWGGAGAETDPIVVSGELVLPARYNSMIVQRGRLNFRGSDGNQISVAFADDGSYTARLMPGVRYTVRVFRLYVTVGAMHYRVPASEFTVEPREIVVPHQGPPLEPRLVIRSRQGEHRVRVIVETSSGRPASGASVSMVGTDERNRFNVPYGVVRTDVEGVAWFRRLPPGRVRVQLVQTGPYARSAQSLSTRRPTSTSSAIVPLGARVEESTGFLLLDAGALHVTVDASGVKGAPPVAVWSTAAELIAGPRSRPDIGGTSAVYRFPSLAPGRYRVVANFPDGKVVFRETEVFPGRVTPLLLTPSRTTAIGYDLVVRWEAIPAAVNRARFFMTPLKREGATSVYEAARGRSVRRRYGDPLRDEPYLLRFPALAVARRIDPSARSRWLVDFTPPKPGFLSRGHRAVTVRVTRGGKPLSDLFVGLKMQKRRGRAEEQWMRYGATTAKGVRFQDVPAGWYELVLLDRVLGARHGVPTQVRRLSIWREDVEVDWALRDRAR
ncbi:MAG: carboxypeptidase-like regulatory domain-containing protein [Planctomycetota bacterium]